MAGGQELPEGEHEFGLNLTADDQLSVVFWQGASKTAVPLELEKLAAPVGYLTVALVATDAVDTFTLEARCGPFRGTAEIKVPCLGEEHDHAPGQEGAKEKGG